MPSLRPKLSHNTPSWSGDGAVFFVTICHHARGTQELVRPVAANILLDAVRVYHPGRWWCRLWVVMPDHVHGLVSVPGDARLARVIGDWKRYTAKAAGIHWQENFFDHRLRHGESWDEKAAYLRANPVRAGLIRDGEVWPWIWEPEEAVATPAG